MNLNDFDLLQVHFERICTFLYILERVLLVILIHKNLSHIPNPLIVMLLHF